MSLILSGTKVSDYGEHRPWLLTTLFLSGSREVSDYGELELRLPEKRAKNSDTDWDADYGWGGGRFGKRSGATGPL